EEGRDEKKISDHLKHKRRVNRLHVAYDFRVDVLRFHTCLTNIFGFLEKYGWWFEQDIDGENEDDNDNKLVMVNEEG
nr:hypothetical protein [Tanacetum cinerariifolium]